MEEWVELSTSSWLVARGNTLADEQKIRPSFWGMSWIIQHSLSSILTALQIFAQINTLAPCAFRLCFASFRPWHFLHSFERTEAFPPHRHTLQPFASKIFSTLCFFLAKSDW
jgi:hypothetical protein